MNRMLLPAAVIAALFVKPLLAHEDDAAAGQSQFGKVNFPTSCSAAMPQPDGSQKALEVHIFPEQMRGTGEGHRPYAPVPNSTMTNGAASGATVAGIDGSTLVVKYKDGEKKIVVPPNAPIVRYEIGSKADLKAGARFTVLAATKRPDGTLEASRINVGRDGVVPQ